MAERFVAGLNISAYASKFAAHELQHAADYSILGQDTIDEEYKQYVRGIRRQQLRRPAGVAAALLAAGTAVNVLTSELLRWPVWATAGGGIALALAGLMVYLSAEAKAPHHTHEDNGHEVYIAKPSEQRARAHTHAYWEQVEAGAETRLVQVSFNLA
ncbi:MAG TPA: hypothetical protein VLE73_02105 [Candidatus Saccharimonadales bacterium]|nr:hypothetical protein [Candidatus Saccharimonadales bacterium]